jgi:protein-tyrosine-phosphatase/predicted ATP-grasp superfamily ATP-dependent carboligase
LASESSRVLILDADSKAGLVCAQSLGSAGCQVHVAVRKRGSLTETSRWGGRALQQPPYAPVEEAVSWLESLDRSVGFTLIVAATEASLRWVRTLPEDHALRTKAVVPSNASLDATLDKQATSRIARELGLHLPESRLLSSAGPVPPAGRFPLVIKPVASKLLIGRQLVSLSVAVVRDPQERSAALAALLPFTDVLEQAWIPGRGVGVEMLYDRGRMAMQFMHQRMHEWPLTGGASTLRRAAEPDAALLDASRRLLDALRWHGAGMVEWRMSAQGRPYLMEINPRLWGSLPLTIAAGVDVPRGLLAIAQGREPPLVRAWRVGTTARDLFDDLRWFSSNLAADRRDPMLLTEPVGVAIRGWTRVLSGREVWDGWRLDDPGVAASNLSAVALKPLAAAGRNLWKRWSLLAVRRRHRRLLEGIARGAGRPLRRLLFLCHGNICRSPFAAQAARLRMPGLAIECAGFFPREGRATPAHIVTLGREFGVDLSAWSSRRASAEEVEAADLILAMDRRNLAALREAFPRAVARSTLLGLFEPQGPAEIADPYSLGPLAAQAVLRQALAAVEGLAGFVSRANAADRAASR